MKIVCDSCGAKYSIADEKVAGRVFKIRCKKCGAAIVVRGDQSAQESAAAGAAPAAGFDYGGEAVWHVVVEGEQQGPFSPAQLGGMISASTIGWDAYVWREGFEDWKPAQDIEELVQAIMNPGAGAGAAEQASHDADPFAEPAAAAPVASAPAASAKADAGADLFAQSDAASPFGGGANPFGGGGDDEDVVASSPSPRVSASQAMTGARNENSVLFSLSNLQALATGGSASGGSASGSSSSAASSGASKSSPAARGGMAAGEGSGLIDIRALASATGVSGGPAPSLSFGGPSSSSPARVDDLLSIGTAAPGLGSALGAPVIIPEKRESGGGRGMIIGAGVLVVGMVCATGVFAMVMMNNQPDPATAIAAVPVGATGVLAPGATAAATPGVDGAPTTTGAAPAAGTAEPAAVAEPAATGTAGAAAAAEAEEEEGDDSGRSGRRRTARGGRSSATPAASASEGASGGTAAAASSGSSSSRRGGGGGGSGDIDDLLGRALAGSSGGGGGGGGGGGAPAEDLPEQPARAAVISALNGVQGAVSACGQGQHGMATVAITVAGSTGRVSGANVTGQFAGTPVGSCVARAVRGARFPRFSRATFVINYPFRI